MCINQVSVSREKFALQLKRKAQLPFDKSSVIARLELNVFQKKLARVISVLPAETKKTVEQS